MNTPVMRHILKNTGSQTEITTGIVSQTDSHWYVADLDLDLPKDEWMLSLEPPKINEFFRGRHPVLGQFIGVLRPSGNVATLMRDGLTTTIAIDSVTHWEYL